MRVLVTGASGHIGWAVIPELLGAGHQVVGLARSDKGAIAIDALGLTSAGVTSTISTAFSRQPPPTHPGLLADLDEGHYFEHQAA